MSRTAVETLEAGRDAVSRYAWVEAFDLLQAADASESLEPDDLVTMAEAAWWTGRLDECIAARERAFAAAMEEGDRRRAALVSIALVKDYYAKGASSIGTAWLSRAERLLEQEPDCVEHGHLERLRSVIALEGAGDHDRAREHAQRAAEIGARFGDVGLQALGLHDEGRALVMSGRVAEGMAMIDEATAPALAGELSPYTTGVIYCNTITACKELADYGRAGDWTEAAKRWCERQEIAGFPGMCRVYRASIMLLKGAWPEAEVEARRACDELSSFNLSYAAEAFYELGEIRLRAGDAGAAEEAFRQAHELGRDPQPGLALLRLAEGNTDGAVACLEQALEEEPGGLPRARLLPAGVEVALAAGDLAAARTRVEELGAIATTYGSDALKAGAHTASARVALAEREARTAAREARQSLRLWQAVGAPYEAAHARLLLAEAYVAEGKTDDAVLELAAAEAAFERLGAVPGAETARARLQALGAAGDRRRGGDAPAERTFLFTDIVSSTKLVEAIGDESWSDLVHWHDATLRSLFATHGGEEVDHAGDGFFVAFPDAASAVECAVAVQRRLAAHRREHGFAPQVRIGLHATSSARDGTAYRGKGVHEAARISALAESGEILASAATLAGIAPRFAPVDSRLVELKGVSEPVEIVSIDWR